jgi:hypothetical protein
MIEHRNIQSELFPELGKSINLTNVSDGLYSEYGPMKNVFPRTMNEAFGMYAALSLPTKTNYKNITFWIHVAILLIIIFLVMRVDQADAFVR